MATYSQSNSEFESKESEFESMPAPSISTIDDYAARTKALNEGQPLEPIVQKAAQKCNYCKTELKGPCAAQFADLYKCAVTKGDKHITSSKCNALADIYLSCVEEDYPTRQTLCPMYMTFLKKNIEDSPCNKQVKMMQKMCKRMNTTRRPGNRQINSICRNATNELKSCVSMTKRSYDYMGFWTRFDGSDNPL